MPQSDVRTNPLGVGQEPLSIVRDGTFSRKSLLALLVLAPGLAGCSSASDMFSRDGCSSVTSRSNRRR
jgi:hypothetical protein